MKRRVLAGIAVIASIALSPGVAGAIATSQFSIDPAPGAPTDKATDRLVVTPERGGSATTSVQLVNKLNRTLVLRMDVVALTVDRDGSAALGGDDRAVGWTSLERERVTLGPKAATVVEATVRVPRSASEAERTIGILAEPVTAANEPEPSVIQRLALVVYVRPHGTASRPILLITLALTVALAVLSALVWLAPSLERRRR
jgi:hypothetical protein